MENKISQRRATQEKIWGKMEDMIPFTDIKIRIELDLSNQPTKITYITSPLIFPIVFGCLFRLRERRSYCPCCYTTWKSITFLFPSFIFFSFFQKNLRILSNLSADFGHNNPEIVFIEGVHFCRQ